MKEKTAFSKDRKYRYTLWRRWGTGKNFVQFIGLNPSTADETLDDPTVRRCIDFAKREGYSAMCMTNIFGFRSTDPHVLYRLSDPIGADNLHWLQEVRQEADMAVACWGNHGVIKEYGKAVFSYLQPLYTFGLTKLGQPRHPLYIRKSAPLERLSL